MKKATLILLVLLLCCGVAAPAAAEQGEAPRPEQNAEETVVRESGEPDPAVPAPVQTPEPDPELTAKYEKRYQEFKKLYPALKGVFAR